MSINKVTLIGHVGQDPELRYTTDGTPVCNVSLATNEVWRDQNNRIQSRTEWHRIVFWRKLAEISAQQLRKGSHIYVEGKIQSREYEDPSTPGAKRKAYEIIANRLRILDSRKVKKEANDKNGEDGIESPK